MVRIGQDSCSQSRAIQVVVIESVLGEMHIKWKYFVGNAIVNQSIFCQKVIHPRSSQFQLHNIVIVVTVISAAEVIGSSAYTTCSSRKAN